MERDGFVLVLQDGMVGRNAAATLGTKLISKS